MYDDPRYDGRHEAKVGSISGTMTATASAGVPLATDCAKYEFFKKVKILGMKAVIDTVPTPAVLSHVYLMNGADQVGDIAIPANVSEGDVVDGTMTATEVTLDADTELQFDVDGTATVSAGVHTVGPLSLTLNWQEQFVGS